MFTVRALLSLAATVAPTAQPILGSPLRRMVTAGVSKALPLRLIFNFTERNFVMRNLAPLVVRRWRSLVSGAAALVVLLGALAVVPLVSGAQGISYTFVNRTRWTIMQIYMQPSSETSWGPDQLGSRVLSPGNSYTLRRLAPDDYDIKVVDEDGDVCERRNVPVYRSTSWVINTTPYLRCIGRS